MGITGLIPFLEKASKPVHLRDLSGSTVAVDSYCWLHKGVFSCAEKLARGEHTDAYIKYCMRYVHLLQSHQIKPILVFDGRHLPAKALTESRRRESRQQAKKRAGELMRLGRHEEARSQLRRCVDVTHEMAWRLMCECRKQRKPVDCIVAPYEADAQLAWLDKVELAQYIITEDSDLTLFGARRVLFKLDLNGAALLVEADKLHLAMRCPPEQYTFDKFRRMCILSGCDYLDSLPGIGLAKACKFILKTEEDNMWQELKKIPEYLKMRQLEVTDEYIERFLQAEATFKHMYIYNSLARRMERLYSLEEGVTDERYCVNAGTAMENEAQALQLALGNLNPFTLKALDDWHPDRTDTAKKRKSIWLTSSKGNSVELKAKPSSPEQQNGSCAIYFKKVDFTSRTIEADISSTIEEENAKPLEAEIFTMYKYQKRTMQSPLAKRRRRSHSVDSDCEATQPPTPTAKSHYNPFARTQEADSAKSPKVSNCPLLRVLSPRELNKLQETQERKLSGAVKRSIFAAAADVQIKSRFFAANHAEVTTTTLASAKSSPTRNTCLPSDLEDDLSSEIETIETKAAQDAQQAAKLYPQSPPEPSNKRRSRSSFDDSEKTLESLDDAIETMANSDAIVLSDEDESNVSHTTMASMKALQLSAFKPTRPRLSLAKPATSTAKRKKTPLTKAKSIAVTDSRQTRLSMFGFQKRPTLS